MNPAFRRWLRTLDADYRRKRNEWRAAQAEEFYVPYEPQPDTLAVEQFLASIHGGKP